MPCINWPAISSRPARRAAAALPFLIAALGIGGSGASAAAATAPRVTVVDDAVAGEAMLEHFDYIGSWQHVRGKHDGRLDGTSTRSTHVGDVAVFRFTGTRVRIYGILGPSGGRSGIALDEESTGGKPVDFYAPRVETHALIYESPVLPRGVHDVAIVVWGTRNARGHYYYVNIDSAEVQS